MSPIVLAPVLIFLAAAIVAGRLGGGPERLAAAILAAWVGTDLAYHALFGPSDFDRVDPVHLVLDTWELIAVVWLALRANRLWPLWAAAAQLICVLGHAAALLQPDGLRHAYWAMTQLPALLQLVALICGTVAYRRRGGAGGDWRAR